MVLFTGGERRRRARARQLRRVRARRRRATVALASALIVAVAVAVLAGSGGSSRRPSAARAAGRSATARSHAGRGRRATTARVARTPPTLTGAPSTPAIRRLGSRVARDLAIPGSHWGAVVLDLQSHRLLVDLHGAIGRAPASVEKLYTTVAALRLLGPGARFATTLLGSGNLGPGGVWHGSLYLRGGGDPTFGDGTFNRLYERGYGPTATQLARQLVARGIRRVTGQLYGDESLLSKERGGMLTDLKPDIPDLGGELSALTYDHGQTTARLGPAEFAAHEMAATLRVMGVRVSASRRTAVTPPGATVLGVVHSPPLRVLISLMNVPSDDLIAELLAEQLGKRFGSGGTIQAGARVISATIAADYGLRPRILDGSGLDPADRTSPLQVVQLLDELWGTPTGALLRGSLPVVGRSGTVVSIATHTPAVGRCQAKTGTLTDISNLAGYCEALGGRPIAFALFDEGPPNYAALAAIGQALGVIARW